MDAGMCNKHTWKGFTVSLTYSATANRRKHTLSLPPWKQRPSEEDVSLTQPPLLFSQEVRLLRTNSPMQSTMVWTIAGWPWRTQSTAKAPATAYKETTFPQVTPDRRHTLGTSEENKPRPHSKLRSLAATSCQSLPAVPSNCNQHGGRKHSMTTEGWINTEAPEQRLAQLLVLL